MSPACSVEGCSEPVKSKGFCSSHYKRNLYYGDPLGGRPVLTPRGAAKRYFNEVVMAYEGDECLIWPFNRDSYGYGCVSENGRNTQAHRVVCKRTHGDPPTPKHQTAHSCGKGHLGCVTKRHLSWKTRKENEADKVLHGTVAAGDRNGMAKLTAIDVATIRGLLGHATQRAIANQFGVHQSTVAAIKSGEKWKGIGL